MSKCVVVHRGNVAENAAKCRDLLQDLFYIFPSHFPRDFTALEFFSREFLPCIFSNKAFSNPPSPTQTCTNDFPLFMFCRFIFSLRFRLHFESGRVWIMLFVGQCPLRETERLREGEGVVGSFQFSLQLLPNVSILLIPVGVSGFRFS